VEFGKFADEPCRLANWPVEFRKICCLKIMVPIYITTYFEFYVASTVIGYNQKCIKGQNTLCTKISQV